MSEVHARVVRRSEIPRALIRDAAHHVAKDESTVQRLREEISDRRLKLETARATEKTVMREPAFHLEEIDRVEACAHTRFAERRFSDCHHDDLGRVTLSRNLDRRALEEIRLVQRALASQKIGPLEKIAGREVQGIENRPRVDLFISLDDDIGDSRDPSWVEIDADSCGSRRAVDNHRSVHERIGITLVPHALRQEHQRRIELHQVERLPLGDNEPVRYLALGQNRPGLIDCDVRDNRRQSFVDEERHVHVIAALLRDKRIDQSFPESALPVEDAGAKDVALELVMIEESPGVDVMRVGDEAEWREEHTHAVGRLSGNARLELPRVD